MYPILTSQDGQRRENRECENIENKSRNTFEALSWSSLDKEESLACQIYYPFNKKIGCFVRQSF